MLAILFTAYLVVAYFTMILFSLHMIQVQHNPDIKFKALGVLISLFAPVTFICLCGWLLLKIIFRK